MSDSAPRRHQTLWIVAAIVLAVVFALLLPDITGARNKADATAAQIKAIAEGRTRAEAILVPLRIGGEIFLRVLKMIVVPLVVASVMSGVLGMGDVRKLGWPGLATAAYFLLTTAIAVVLGIILVNVIRPGGHVRIDEPGKLLPREQLYKHLAQETGLKDDDVARVFNDAGYVDQKHPSVGRILENLALMLFTDNLFQSAAKMELLPLIVFSIVFAGLLTTMGDRVSGLTGLIVQANDALMAFVLFVMRFAPLGIFCLVAARFGTANVTGGLWQEIQKTGWYSFTILLGLATHGFLILPGLLYLFTRRNPLKFYGQMSQALLTAFSTASSNASLPVNIECAVERARINRKAVDFVLPLGATVNMDGTALYEAVAPIFIAQVLGIEMTLTQNVVIAVTAALAAIGAAGIPEAGLVTMVIVMAAVDLPTEHMSLILSVDWLLDRFRTTVNVVGDSIAAAVVERYFPPDAAPSASQ